MVTTGKQNSRVLRTVHCREVFNTVSLSRRVHYQRFHCIGMHTSGYFDVIVQSVQFN